MRKRINELKIYTENTHIHNTHIQYIHRQEGAWQRRDRISKQEFIIINYYYYYYILEILISRLGKTHCHRRKKIIYEIFEK